MLSSFSRLLTRILTCAGTLHNQTLTMTKAQSKKNAGSSKWAALTMRSKPKKTRRKSLRLPYLRHMGAQLISTSNPRRLKHLKTSRRRLGIEPLNYPRSLPLPPLSQKKSTAQETPTPSKKRPHEESQQGNSTAIENDEDEQRVKRTKIASLQEEIDGDPSGKTLQIMEHW